MDVYPSSPPSSPSSQDLQELLSALEASDHAYDRLITAGIIAVCVVLWLIGSLLAWVFWGPLVIPIGTILALLGIALYFLLDFLVRQWLAIQYAKRLRERQVLMQQLQRQQPSYLVHSPDQEANAANVHIGHYQVIPE